MDDVRQFPFSSILHDPVVHLSSVLSTCDLEKIFGPLQVKFPNTQGSLPLASSWNSLLDLGTSIPLQSMHHHHHDQPAFQIPLHPNAKKLLANILSETSHLATKGDSDNFPVVLLDANHDHSIPSTEQTSHQSHLPNLEDALKFPTFKSMPPQINAVLPRQQNTSTSFKYAVKISTESDISQVDFQRLVPKPACQWPFTLDSFQKHAIVCLEQQQSVFIAAHTSAGKTVIAEYAIRLCEQNGTRAIYTSPIKALSNQKYRDFKRTFSDVGLITGDIQIGQNAKCLIMTTEILRSMLYGRSEVIHELEWVIFDEVHYINDPERGVVWEEVLILLPPNVGIILLSATVSNTMEFAEWIGQIKKRPVHVISTAKRPIPLEHYLFCGTSRKDLDQLFMVVDKNRQFLTEGYNRVLECLRGTPVSASTKVNLSQVKAEKAEKGTLKRGGKVNTPGRGAGGFGKHSGGASTHKSGGNAGTSFSAQQKREETQWLAVVDLLQKADKLPAVVFLFSKRRITQLVSKMRTVELLSKSEEHRVRTLTRHWVRLLREDDRQLPQVLFMFQLLYRGIACHHSGILPLLKEMVEILFQEGLVKLLFATETFAMGVNMPARTVVFESLQKFDGSSLRYLNPSEYTQMAGRAGRRGLDTTGTVIVVLKSDLLTLPPVNEMQKVMLGRSVELRSQFRLTYAMLLNGHLSQTARPHDMLKFTFIQANELRNSDKMNERLATLTTQKQLAILCEQCSPEVLNMFYKRILEWQECRFVSLQLDNVHLSKSPGLSHANVDCGRLVVFYTAHSLSPQSLGHLRVGIWLKPGRNSGHHCVLTYAASDAAAAAGEDSMLSSVSIALPLFTVSLPIQIALALALQRVTLPQTSSVAALEDISPDRIAFIASKKLEHFNGFPLNPSKVEDILEDFHNRLLGRLSHVSISETLHQTYQLLFEFASQQHCLQLLDIMDAHKESQAFTNHSQLILDYQKWRSISCELVHSQCQQWAESCLHCTNFVQHILYFAVNDNRKKEISQLKFALSDHNLSMLPDFESKVAVLKQMHYLSKQNTVTLRGRIACEVGLHELVLTELLLQGVTQKLNSSEMAALMSCFVYEKSNHADATLEQLLKKVPTAPLQTALSEVVQIAQKIATAEKDCGVTHSVSSASDGIHMGVVVLVHAWAEQTTMAVVMQLGLQLHNEDNAIWPEPEEGILVRTIQRLDELLRHIRSSAKIMGNGELEELALDASMKIRRDIVFAPSLYTLDE